MRIFKRYRPQLVLLDISLPDMNGVEVLQIMRTIDPNLNIIILTGRDDIELAKRTLEIGAIEFITKPFESDSLQTKIGRLLDEIPTRAEDCGRPWRMSS